MLDKAMRDDEKPEEALEILDSVLANYEGDLTTTQRVAILQRQGELAMKIGMYNKASRTFAELKGYNVKLSLRERLTLDRDASQSAFYCGEYPAALKGAFDLMGCEKPDSLRTFDVDACLLLSNICLRLGETDEAVNYLEKAKEMAGKLNMPDKKREFDYEVLLGKSSVALSLHRYEEAYRYLEDCYKLGDLDHLLPYCRETNLAWVYGMENAPQLADQCYERIRKAPGLHYNKCVAMNNYAAWLLLQRRPEEAIAVTDENQGQLEKIQATHALANMWMLRRKGYELLEEYGKANECADSAENIMMSLLSQNNSHIYSNLLSKYEADNIVAQYGKTRAWLIALGIAALLLLIGVILLTRKWLRTNKQCKQVEKEKDEVSAKLDNYMDGHLDEVNKLQDELDKKNRELVHNELKHTHTIEKISTFISDNVAQGATPSFVLESIVKELKKENPDKAYWDEYQKYFDEVHPRFYDTLTALHPTLTTGEKRMCGFILSGMKTQEIATLINRSARTVESMKYRLKKKLDLSPEMSLDRYIADLKIDAGS